MQFPYTLGVVAIMKNEAPYVVEWLDYHLNAGVDIVYLYDNDSTDNLKEIILPYVQQGRVIYHDFPGDYRQIPCYHDALQRYRFLCKYLAFIDADEFIYPTNNGSIKDFVEDYFKEKEDVGGLLISWVFFGSGGEEKADCSRGVLERFQKRGKEADYTCKSIINPRLVFDFYNSPHEPAFLNGVSDKDEFGNTYFEKNKFSGEKIFIAHYAVKSKEEWLKRRASGDVFYKESVVADENGTMAAEVFNFRDQNDVEDTRVYEYYLKNMQKTLMGGGNAQDCLTKNFEILKSGNMSIEEYLSLYHIYTTYKYLLNEESRQIVYRYLKQTIVSVVNNIGLLRDLELFLSDLPYLLKTGMERETVKQLALYAYHNAETLYLKNKEFLGALILRGKKEWIDNL